MNKVIDYQTLEACVILTYKKTNNSLSYVNNKLNNLMECIKIEVEDENNIPIEIVEIVAKQKLDRDSEEYLLKLITNTGNI